MHFRLLLFFIFQIKYSQVLKRLVEHRKTLYKQTVVSHRLERRLGYKYCLLYAYTRQMGTYDHLKYYMGWLA